MDSVHVILASASPRRAALLAGIVKGFDIVPSAAAEMADSSVRPAEAATANALAKARDVARSHPDALVIGADTVVAVDGRNLGKPTDLADARRMLAVLSGNTHTVVTGVAAVCLALDTEVTGTEETEVRFRRLDRGVIEWYVSEYRPLDKAGAYGIQEIGDVFVESLRGSYENVVGLPLDLTARLLSEAVGHRD